MILYHICLMLFYIIIIESLCMMNESSNKLGNLVSKMYISNESLTDMELLAPGTTSDKKYYIFKNAGEDGLKTEIERLNKELLCEKHKNKLIESKLKNLKNKMDSLKVQLMEEKTNSKITECYLKEVVGDIHLWQEENVKAEMVKQVLKEELNERDEELKKLRDVKEQYEKLVEEKPKKIYENAQTMTQNESEQENEQGTSFDYQRKIDMLNTEIAVLKNEMKLHSKSSNNELKKIIKELLEYKSKCEKVENELSETKRTISNLNTLVEELGNCKSRNIDWNEKREIIDNKKDEGKIVATNVLSCGNLQVVKKNEIRNNSVRLFVGMIPPNHRVQILDALCSNGIDMLKDVIQSEIYIEEADNHMNLYAALNIPTGKFEQKIKKFVEKTLLST